MTTSASAKKAWDTRGRGRKEAKPVSARTAKALATHKPSTKAKQDAATKAEQRVRDILGGEQTDDNKPVDVIVRHGKKTHGVEVKSVSDNGNNKRTMHPESLARKVDWAAINKGTLHTVVVDIRSGTILYRAGVGSFRLHTMTIVNNNAHLRRLLGLE